MVGFWAFVGSSALVIILIVLAQAGSVLMFIPAMIIITWISYSTWISELTLKGGINVKSR